jgi:Family of unknown function (DUF5670)
MIPIGATSRVEGRKMLETIAVVLIILWLLGLVSSYTMGGFIHLLLVVAIVVILVRVVQGRAPLG